MEKDQTIFSDAISAIIQAASLEDMSRALHNIRDRCGTANIGYHSLKLPGIEGASNTILATCDPDWIKRYIVREYIKRYIVREYVEIDPVVKAGQETILPVDWDRVERTSANAKRYFLELDRFEIGKTGISIPLYGPYGDAALFTFTSHHAHQPAWQTLRESIKAELVLLARYVHDRVLSFTQTNATEKSRLTRQEKACLQLFAQGHTPMAIGKILGLSIHTVRMHLAGAKERLSCQSKAEAVAKAISLGIIRPKARIMLVTTAGILFLKESLLANMTIPFSNFA